MYIYIITYIDIFIHIYIYKHHKDDNIHEPATGSEPTAISH